MNYHKEPINGNTLTLLACAVCLAMAALAYYATLNY